MSSQALYPFLEFPEIKGNAHHLSGRRLDVWWLICNAYQYHYAVEETGRFITARFELYHEISLNGLALPSIKMQDKVMWLIFLCRDAISAFAHTRFCSAGMVVVLASRSSIKALDLKATVVSLIVSLTEEIHGHDRR